MLITLAVFAGLGNSVFHPADYAILSRTIDESRVARAFSIHTFFGFFGTACAPPVMLASAAMFGWRTSFIIIGLVGSLVWALIALRGQILDEGLESAKNSDVPKTTATHDRSGFNLLLSPPVLLFLLFFAAYGVASGGLSAFTASALINLHGLTQEAANMALTGLLFGVAGGVFAAGFVVDRSDRHVLLASGALTLSILCVGVPAFLDAPGVVFAGLMACVGFGMGAVPPPRDL
ncbi:MAG: MFS transporter, partial [Alphaproteobacteria bacterium]|nr:MFS transporter [Alphaproteobacteria bacterium]